MIRNFGRVTDNFYRGAQPRVDGHRNEYAELARLGIRTVINLCSSGDGKADERDAAKKVGLLYHWLPMNDHDYPQPEAAPNFLAVATDPKWQPIFVHCAGGRHRTGAMTAVYRVTVDKWELKAAMKELESYFGWPIWAHWVGHREIQKFVKEYWAELNKHTNQRVLK